MRRKYLKHILNIFFISVVFMVPAYGKSKILKFEASLSLKKDGTLWGRENILLDTDGQDFSEGLPRYYPGSLEIYFTQILHNNKVASMKSECRQFGKVHLANHIFLIDPKSPPRKGVHKYSITYYIPHFWKKSLKVFPFIFDSKIEEISSFSFTSYSQISQVKVKFLLDHRYISSSTKKNPWNLKVPSNTLILNHLKKPGSRLVVEWISGISKESFPQKRINSYKQLLSQEEILSFQSEIWIQKDGWIKVKETIQVRCKRIKIRRGIYRDFPTKYRRNTWGGLFYTVPFEVLKVLRNGSPEDYHIVEKSNGKRVYIGNPKRFLTSGIYTYT
ncbi:MAG: DUF2207 domain-containing protein, partial [Planctomycetota bacterium]